MKLKKVLVLGGFAFLVATSPSSFSAVDEIIDVNEHSDLYYSIGGASPVPLALNNDVDFLDLGLSGEVGLGYSCGKFDPKASLASAFNGLEDLGDDIEMAATGALMGLPMYFFQRWNPDAANLFKNYKFELEEYINIAIKSCQDIESDLSAGDDPYGEWATYGKGVKWGEEVEANDGDVLAAEDGVKQGSADVSFPWGDDKAGGPGDPSIKINTDATRFGYNQLTGRSLSATGAPSSSSRIKNVFPTVEDAEQFVVDLVGETELSGTEDGPRPTETPAKGIHYRVEKERDAVWTDFHKAVQGDESAIARIQSPAVQITPELLESVKALGSSGRSITINRLSSDIAVAKVIDQAYVALRLLRAGSKETTVKKSPAHKEVSRSVDMLYDEVVWLEREMNARKNLVSTVAKTLILRRKREIANSPLPSQNDRTNRRPSMPLNGG